MSTEMNAMKEILLAAPDTQLDATMKPLIEKWGEPPLAIQILEVLDHTIHGGLASGMVVYTLQMLYDAACKKEGVTHEQIVSLATWRNEL